MTDSSLRTRTTPLFPPGGLAPLIGKEVCGLSLNSQSNYGRYYFISPEGTSTWYDPRKKSNTGGSTGQSGESRRASVTQPSQQQSYQSNRTSLPAQSYQQPQATAAASSTTAGISVTASSYGSSATSAPTSSAGVQGISVTAAPTTSSIQGISITSAPASSSHRTSVQAVTSQGVSVTSSSTTTTQQHRTSLTSATAAAATAAASSTPTRVIVESPSSSPPTTNSFTAPPRTATAGVTPEKLPKDPFTSMSAVDRTLPRIPQEESADRKRDSALAAAAVSASSGTVAAMTSMSSTTTVTTTTTGSSRTSVIQSSHTTSEPVPPPLTSSMSATAASGSEKVSASIPARQETQSGPPGYEAATGLDRRQAPGSSKPLPGPPGASGTTFTTASDEKAKLAASSEVSATGYAYPAAGYGPPGAAGRASMAFSDVPLDGGAGDRTSFSGAPAESWQSTAPILAAAAAPGMTSIYDHANYTYETHAVAPQGSASYPASEIYAAAPVSVPNYGTAAVPAPAQIRERGGTTSESFGNVNNQSGGVGTMYERGVGAGSGGVGYSAVPTADDPRAANANRASAGPGRFSPTSGVISPPHAPSPRGSLRRGASTKRYHGGYCCGCFRTRAGCCAFWWVIVVIILAGLGIAAYFLYPRIPQVWVSDPYAPTDEKPLITSGSLASASSTTPYTIQFNLRTNISVYSPNNIDVKVDKLTLTGVLLDDSNKQLNARANGQKTDLVFKSKENTTFVLPVTMTYSVTTPATLIDLLALQDPVINVLAKACGWVGSTRTPIKMDYTAEATIGLISWTGYKPKFDGRLNFNCPVDSNTLLTLIRRRRRGEYVVVDLI
ncbi:hypothetical protein HDU96_010298 [Phlyctochytrium bullatum]|nr:hypothetical protein HDU96_010298 [Phlyctochytrium bullatum]